MKGEGRRGWEGSLVVVVVVLFPLVHLHPPFVVQIQRKQPTATVLHLICEIELFFSKLFKL